MPNDHDPGGPLKGARGNYEVGFGKPPKHTRYQKGQTGNRYGRPCKSDKRPFEGRANPTRDIILEEMARQVTLQEDGQPVEMESLRAVIRAANFAAIKGRVGAQKLVLGFATEADRLKREEKLELIQAVEQYKQRFEPIFEHARKTGAPEPSQLPHPDHVNIDPSTAEMVFTGPMNKDEKKGWDFLKWRLRNCERMMRFHQRELDADPNNQSFQKRLEISKDMVRISEREGVPKGWNPREKLGWEDAYDRQFLKQLKIDPDELEDLWKEDA